MIDLPMVPFFTKLPDIAAVETRELIIVNNSGKKKNRKCFIVLCIILYKNEEYCF